MKLNKSHSLVKRLNENELERLEKFARDEEMVEIVFKLLHKDTTVSMDDANWALKRARLDGQEQLITTFKGLFKD